KTWAITAWLVSPSTSAGILALISMSMLLPDSSMAPDFTSSRRRLSPGLLEREGMIRSTCAKVSARTFLATLTTMSPFRRAVGRYRRLVDGKRLFSLPIRIADTTYRTGPFGLSNRGGDGSRLPDATWQRLDLCWNLIRWNADWLRKCLGVLVKPL